MAISAFSGPVVVFGQSPLAGQEYNPDLAPSMFWGGTAILDPRLQYTYLPGEAQLAQDFGWLGVDNVTTLSVVPYTKATGAIVASANPTGPTLSLVSASSATTGVYITPSITRADTGVIDTNGGAGLVALDAYVSATASITNGVMTVTANTTMPITPGMVILTAGGSLTSGTVAGTVITGQLTGGTGGQGVAGTYSTNNQSLTVGSGTVTLALPTPGSCAVPFGAPFSVYLWNPQALIGRAVAVTAASGATYTTATVSGYDVYGFPMVEAITLTAGSQVAGKKAWKYIRSVVLSGGTADTTHAYSVDTTDVFGFPLRSDNFGDIVVNYAAGSMTAITGITAATGYLPSDRTVATSTTGDVRGTFSAFTSSTGANKLVIRQSPQAYNIGSAAGLFGVTQYANF
jgi:hypothetical protein